MTTRTAQRGIEAAGLCRCSNADQLTDEERHGLRVSHQVQTHVPTRPQGRKPCRVQDQRDYFRAGGAGCCSFARLSTPHFGASLRIPAHRMSGGALALRADPLAKCRQHLPRNEPLVIDGGRSVVELDVEENTDKIRRCLHNRTEGLLRRSTANRRTSGRSRIGIGRRSLGAVDSQEVRCELRGGDVSCAVLRYDRREALDRRGSHNGALCRVHASPQARMQVLVPSRRVARPSSWVRRVGHHVSTPNVVRVTWIWRQQPPGKLTNQEAKQPKTHASHDGTLVALQRGQPSKAARVTGSLRPPPGSFRRGLDGTVRRPDRQARAQVSPQPGHKERPEARPERQTLLEGQVLANTLAEAGRRLLVKELRPRQPNLGKRANDLTLQPHVECGHFSVGGLHQAAHKPPVVEHRFHELRAQLAHGT
eukprot:scaffold273_cov242-Pinguiococcus_pyrenoidosus.AAC.28